MAVSKKSLSLVRLLLSFNPKIDIRDNKSRTPIDILDNLECQNKILMKKLLDLKTQSNNTQ
jgi:hypothetical protein